MSYLQTPSAPKQDGEVRGADSGEGAPHYRALDGLRGVAILIVFYFHTWSITWPAFPPGTPEYLSFPLGHYGWTGVDLFFVLSGFLITGVLLRARTASNYYSAFYMRRVLRLAPLYYLAVVATFEAHWFHRWSPVYPLRTQIWYWFDLSNIPNAMQKHVVAPLGHFWTLAVEEQFYLLWPFLMRKLRPRALLAFSIAAIVLEACIRALPPVLALTRRTDNSFIYRLTFTHSEGLFAGAAVAILLHEGLLKRDDLGWLRYLAAVLLALAYTAVHFDPPPWIPVRTGVVLTFEYTLLSTAFASVIAVLAIQRGEGLLSRALSWQPLRMMGRYSYCLYVLHIPLLLFCMTHFFVHVRSMRMLALECLLTFAFAVAIAGISWRVLELPLQAQKRHFPFRGTHTGSRSAGMPTRQVLQ